MAMYASIAPFFSVEREGNIERVLGVRTTRVQSRVQSRVHSRVQSRVHGRLHSQVFSRAFNFLTYQPSTVGYWLTVAVTGNGALGFDAGEGA